MLHWLYLRPDSGSSSFHGFESATDGRLFTVQRSIRLMADVQLKRNNRWGNRVTMLRDASQ